MSSIIQWVQAHGTLVAALIPLYVALWSLALGWLSRKLSKWPKVATILHVLALSPAPRTLTSALQEFEDAVKEEMKK